METEDDDNLEDNIDNSMNKSDKPKKSSKTVKKRSKCRVIRSVWFNEETDPIKYYRELIFLFMPWRDEDLTFKVFIHLNTNAGNYVSRLTVNWHSMHHIKRILMKQCLISETVTTMTCGTY